MSKGLIPKDESLVRELYDKLEWLTFEAEENEFDAEQVNAIVTLLDSMDPDGIYDVSGVSETLRNGISEEEAKTAPAVEEDPLDVDAAFSRFKKKFSISDEEIKSKVWEEKSSKKTVRSYDREVLKRKLAKLQSEKEASESALTAYQKTIADTMSGEENGDSKRSSFRVFTTQHVMKAAATILVVAAAFVALNIGTNAVADKSFFEIVRDGVNGMRVTVTGNEPEIKDIDNWTFEAETRVDYTSWEEMEKAAGVSLIQPEFLPEGLKLEELYSEEAISYISFHAIYSGEEKLIVTYNIYHGDYSDEYFDEIDEWEKYESPDKNPYGAEYYKNDDGYKAFLVNDKSLIFVSYVRFDELTDIVNGMK